MIRNAYMFLGLCLFATLALFPGCGEEPTGPVTTNTSELAAAVAGPYYLSQNGYNTAPNGYRYSVNADTTTTLYTNTATGRLTGAFEPYAGSYMPYCQYDLVKYWSNYTNYPYSTPSGAFKGWQNVYANAEGSCYCANTATWMTLQPDTFRWYMTYAGNNYMVSKFGSYNSGRPVLCGMQWDGLSGGIWPQ